MKKQDLIKKIKQLRQITGSYNKFLHLFSEDIAIKTMAKLNALMSEIEYLLTISTLKKSVHPSGKAIQTSSSTGKLVRIKPCAKKYNDKTYLGIYIGEVALSSAVQIDEKTIKCEWARYNPAILIPDLNEIVYGIESFWGFLKDDETLTDITGDDIANLWYMKLLKKK